MHPIELQFQVTAGILIANDLARGGSITIRSGSTTTHNNAQLTPAQFPQPVASMGSPTIANVHGDQAILAFWCNRETR